MRLFLMIRDEKLYPAFGHPEPVRSPGHSEDHPVIPELNDLFGEHTFFLDHNGLNIVEPAEAAAGAAAQSIHKE
jgi:hypothetical protein